MTVRRWVRIAVATVWLVLVGPGTIWAHNLVHPLTCIQHPQHSAELCAARAQRAVKRLEEKG